MTITTETEIAALQPREKGYKVFLGGGLYLWVAPTGSRSYRADYKHASGCGDNKVFTFGRHPALTLAQAKAQLAKLRDDVKHGINPGERKAEARQLSGHRFKATAERYLDARVGAVSDRYLGQIRRNFELYVYEGIEGQAAGLGNRRLEDIETVHITRICRAIEARPAPDVASDVRMWIGMVFTWAKNEGIRVGNPAEDVALVKAERTHFAKIGEMDMPRFFADLNASPAEVVTKLGLRIMAHLVPRTSTMRLFRWSWVDWQGAMIRVPAEAMKDSTAAKTGHRKQGDFLIPLSLQALALLRELQQHTGRAALMFPHRTKVGQPNSSGTWLVALKRMGWTGELDESHPNYRPNATIHGFRATFQTTVKARFAATVREVKACDRQLDHVDADKVNAAYERDSLGGHRGLYLPERIALMQRWSDHLDALEGNTVTDFPERPVRVKPCRAVQPEQQQAA